MQQNSVGQIINLFIATKESTTPIKVNTLEVDRKGILSDKHYDKDIDRSVLITSLDSYQMVIDENISIAHGALGENLLIDYNPYALPVGSRLKIGDAILEISQPCTLCGHLSSIDKKVPTLLKNDRGVFARVVQEGMMKVNDKIYLLS